MRREEPFRFMHLPYVADSGTNDVGGYARVMFNSLPHWLVWKEFLIHGRNWCIVMLISRVLSSRASQYKKCSKGGLVNRAGG